MAEFVLLSVFDYKPLWQLFFEVFQVGHEGSAALCQQ